MKGIISKHVKEEVERNLKKDVPQTIPIFQEFLDTVPFKIVHPTKQEVEEAALCVDLKDAAILAAARKAKADYLISLDTHHLVGVPRVAKCAKIEIILPSELLKIIRN